ncbi:MAG: flagellin-like protein, partial [Proteobacteria bacterium]|nr:flagellin-like protein [Pseudomonadota bacterium]
MAEQVTLSAAVRSSLLSLQSTTKLIDRTQGRLASGLRVAGPVDDPVSFFQAKSLNDRAFDFNEKKDGIDQGISAVTAALDGVDSIETLVRQIKGVANSMKSAEASQMSNLITQFNDLRTQINNLAADATFQGTNLINGTGTTLTIEFSEKSASVLNIASTDITVGTAGLSIGQTVAFTGQFDGDVATATVGTNSINFVAGTGTDANNFRVGHFTATITLTYEGGNFTYTTADSLLFTYGTNVLTVSVGGDTVLNKEDVLTIQTFGTATTGFYRAGDT